MATGSVVPARRINHHRRAQLPMEAAISTSASADTIHGINSSSTSRDADDTGAMPQTRRDVFNIGGNSAPVRSTRVTEGKGGNQHKVLRCRCNP